ELVLTAHPTEATRRTILLAHVRIGDLVASLDDPRLTGAERSRVERQLIEQITILWQTDEGRHERPRVVDEIRHGLWFFEHSLMDASERLVAWYRETVPGARPLLSFGSWIGGGIGGDPQTGPGTSPTALPRARAVPLPPLP